MSDDKATYRIAILDNCEIGTLTRMKRENTSVEDALGSYDFILIPGWVWEEVCDSTYRKDYIHTLIKAGYPIKIIPEERYIKIVNEELTLLTLFELGIRPFSEIRSYLYKTILKRKEKVEIDYLYEEWIGKIYNEWPIEGKMITRSSGEQRMQKKNAGEISIALLAHLLAYQKEANVEVTIWTHDADCRKCMNEIELQTKKKNYISLKPKIFFSYKNFDNILLSLIKSGRIDRIKAHLLIDKIRQERKVIYTKCKDDNSTELRNEIVDNERFKEILDDENVKLIW